MMAKEWKEAAATLDAYLHFDDWKRVDEDPYYDFLLGSLFRVCVS